MRVRVGLALAVAMAISVAIGCAKKSSDNTTGSAAQGADLATDSSDAQQTSLDLSEAGQGGGLAFAPDSPRPGDVYAVPAPGMAASAVGCSAQVVVISTAHACAFAYRSNVHVSWNCSAGNAMVAGSSNIATTVTPAACPGVTVAQTMDFTRTRSLQQLSSTLAGNVAVTWSATAALPALSRHVVYDLTRKVTQGSTLVRDQSFTGDRDVTLQLNGAGKADDVKIVSGTGTDQFHLANFSAAITDSALEFHRSCCYPLAGTFSYTLSGSRTGAGSVTFGATCGDATDETGSPITLPTCGP